MPPLLQSNMFNPAALLAQVYQVVGPSYPPGSKRAVDLAVAEAISWLVTEGLLVPDPGQPSPGFYVPMRRARPLPPLRVTTEARAGAGAKALTTRRSAGVSPNSSPTTHWR